MTSRWILDSRVGAAWPAAALETLRTVAAAAWADPAHPSSEGRRSAVWIEAARATVRDLTGFPHVAFMARRDEAMVALIAAMPGSWQTSATNRQFVLRQVTGIAPVDEDGRAQFSATASGAEPGIRILQAANEETGVIDAPVDGAMVLDATATFGRAPLPYEAGIVIADARAWGSPADVAVVLGRRPLSLRDSAQVPDVVVAVEQLSHVLPGMEARSRAEAEAIDAFTARLTSALPDVQFHGRERVPHIRSFSILHLDAETLMRALDAQGYVVGSGSACVLDGRPSHVLAAMGRVTHGNLRLSLPWDLDLAVLERFADVVAQTARRLREEAGVADL